MKERINFLEKGQGALKALYGINKYLTTSSIEISLLELVFFRVSQINGCAFCLDMHSKELRAMGETEQRLYALNSWRDTPFYSDKERAAFAWAEAVTKCAVPDVIYAEAVNYFPEEELIDLTLAVAAINTYNRLNSAFHPPVGTYQVGQFNMQSKQVK